MLLCHLDPPNTIYTYLSQALLFWLICHTPIKNRGLSVDPWPFPTVLTMKTSKKKHRSHARYMLSDMILAWWRRPVSSSEALDLLHWAMRAVMYRRIAMAIKTGTFLGVFVDCCLFACCPGSRWGNTEQVVTRWWLPGASSVALDLLHRVMPRSLLQRIRMAIEMACDGGTFVCHCWFYHWP